MKLLLLHGFTGDRHAFDHLDFERPAVSIDLPGHGDAPDPTRFDDCVEGLAAHGSCDVLGYSMGARLALAHALAHPSMVRRLVLVSGSPGIDDAHARAARRRDDEKLARSIERLGARAFVKQWDALPLFGGVRKPPRRVRAHGLAQALRALGTGAQPSFWSELPRLRVPVLIVTGTRDAKFTEIGRRMAAELPWAWHAQLPAAHVVHVEAANELTREVRNFLEAS